MKMLKNAGTFDILTPTDELTNQLLRIERAGRTCYQSEESEITLESAKKFVRMILKRGHESVIEHSNMTVRFSNISRGFTHEMVRHRLCAFSQESTRYVDYAKTGEGIDLEKFQLHCIVPPHKNEEESFSIDILGDRVRLTPLDMFQIYENCYRALRQRGWAAQDARQFLPIGLRSQIVVSANFREWRHIFTMRTGKPAHWEIRGVMGNLLEQVQGIVPIIFSDFIERGNDLNGVRYFEKIGF